MGNENARVGPLGSCLFHTQCRNVSSILSLCNRDDSNHADDDHLEDDEKEFERSLYEKFPDWNEMKKWDKKDLMGDHQDRNRFVVCGN